jgi:hypothetical protein
MDDIEKRILIAVLTIILVILSIAAAIILLSIPSLCLGHPKLEAASTLTLWFLNTNCFGVGKAFRFALSRIEIGGRMPELRLRQ